jgi:hypothetical protein
MKLIAGSSDELDFSGDFGPAVGAGIGVAGIPWVDTGGNVYIPETQFDSGSRIRIVNSTTGVIRTFGGGSGGGDLGELHEGTTSAISSAVLYRPISIVGDSKGTLLYISDFMFGDIDFMFATNNVSVFAGGPFGLGLLGDYGPASSARLEYPAGIWLTSSGNLYIADCGNQRIRMILNTNNNNSIITTVVGSDGIPFSGDGGPATLATLFFPVGVYVDTLGKVFIADYFNNRIRLVDPNKIITTFAGTGAYEPFNGDRLPATAANIDSPRDVKGDASGNIYIAEEGRNIIRKVDVFGIISVLFGTPGEYGFSGPEWLPASSLINSPRGIWGG